MAERRELRRGLTLYGAIAVNVANMIGTGVFLKSRVMTCNVGDAWLVLFVWLAAGLMALAGCFVYSELAAMMPQAGGEYVFLRRAFGRLTGFLFGWTSFIVVKPAALAALATGFAIFMNVAFAGALEGASWHTSLFGHGLTFSPLTAVALGAIWLVAALNCASVESSGRLAVALTLAKVALVLLVALSAFLFGHGDFAHFAQSGLSGSCEGVNASARGGLAGFGAAMLGALWAYDGWANVTPLIGEIENPARNVSRAFIGGTLAVAALYLSANAAYFWVLSPTEIASVSQTSSVASVVLSRFLGPLAVGFTAAALMLSSFGSAQASGLAGSRVPFAMARDGLLPRGLGVLSRNDVPARAIVTQAAWASLLALSGTYDTLTDAVIFTTWLFVALVVAALFWFRRHAPDVARPYRTFGYPWLPAALGAAAVALVINTFVATPQQAFGGVAVVLAGLPVYAYFARGAR